MNQIQITLENGKWLVNGNPYNAMTLVEKDFFHRFLNEVRISRGVDFDEPITTDVVFCEVKRLVDKIDITDPIFDKPLSELTVIYEDVSVQEK
jgi:HSP20 family molecular chaperone IbpA